MKSSLAAGFFIGFIIGMVLGMTYGKKTKSKIGDSVTTSFKGGKLIVVADAYKATGLDTFL